MKKQDKLKIALSGIALSLIGVGSIIYMTFFKTYDVIFDSKMGTRIEAQKVKKGENAIKPNDPVMTGYTFEGWYLDGEKYDFDKGIEKNITLEGKWQKIV